jgi:hypothetical protein
MIAVKQKAPKPKNDNYRTLAEYITDAKRAGEKVLSSWFVGCAGDDDYSKGIAEVEDTQSLNTRSERVKTYHLVVSFRPEDEAKLTPDIFREIEREFAQALGFEEHQRHCSVHKNTNNLHLHIGYNMIHPEKLTRKEPYRDYRKLSEACRRLEDRYGLNVDKGMTDNSKGEKSVRIAQGAAAMEAHTGQQSFQSYAGDHKAAILEALNTADSWQVLHESLAMYGLEIKPQGNGLIVKNRHGKEAVKASSLDRSLSMKKLEARFGGYVPGNGLENVEEQARYSARPLHHDPERGGLFAEWKEIKARRAEAFAAIGELKEREKEVEGPIRQKWKEKREELRQNRLPRRHIYALTRKSRQLEAEELKQAKAGILAERAVHRALLKQEPATWVDFLRGKAAQGNELALAVLRSGKFAVEAEAAATEQAERFDFERAQQIRDKWRQTRDRISDSQDYGIKRKGLLSVAKAHELEELERLDPNAPSLFSGFTSDIDHRGTVLIKLAGGGMIRDTGKEIRFSAHDPTAKAAALLFAKAKWGKDTRLEGNLITRHEREREQTPQTPPATKAIPTTEEARESLLKIARLEPLKVEQYYRDQIAPYMEHFAAAKDAEKSEAFAFCRRQMLRDVNTDKSVLERMRGDLFQTLRKQPFANDAERVWRVDGLMGLVRLQEDRQAAFNKVVELVEQQAQQTRNRGMSR